MPHQPDQPPTIKLVGIAGFVAGEVYPIALGQTTVIGRSRSCDISLRKCPKYLAVDPDEAHTDQHFRTVSRRHVTVQFIAPDEVVIRDTSQNGTFLDGRRIAQACVLKNLREKFHELKLGTNETFRLQWGDKVIRKKVRLVEVPEGGEPPVGAVAIDEPQADVPELAEEPAAVDASPKAASGTDELEARLKELDELDELSELDDVADVGPEAPADEPPIPDLDFKDADDDDDLVLDLDDDVALTFSDEEELDLAADPGDTLPDPEIAFVDRSVPEAPKRKSAAPKRGAPASRGKAKRPARMDAGNSDALKPPPSKVGQAKKGAKKVGAKKKSSGLIGKRLRRK